MKDWLDWLYDMGVIKEKPSKKESAVRQVIKAYDLDFSERDLAALDAICKNLGIIND